MLNKHVNNRKHFVNLICSENAIYEHTFHEKSSIHSESPEELKMITTFNSTQSSQEIQRSDEEARASEKLITKLAHI